MIRVLATTASLPLLLSSPATLSAGEVVTYPAPQGGDLSTEYEVTVDGKRIDLYRARTLDPPFADKQRDYGGPYSFANFDMAGQVEVRVTSKCSLTETVIRPVSAGVQAKDVDDHTLTFQLDRPRKLSIEPDGRSGPLLLFANPMQEAPPQGR